MNKSNVRSNYKVKKLMIPMKLDMKLDKVSTSNVEESIVVC